MGDVKVINPYATQKNQEVRSDYEECQLVGYQRKYYNIRAFKVLDATETQIYVRLPNDFGKDKRAEIPSKKGYKPGQYVDISLSYTTYGGQATNYRTRIWGLTPEKFIPENGEEIGGI